MLVEISLSLSVKVPLQNLSEREVVEVLIQIASYTPSADSWSSLDRIFYHR